MLNSDDDDDEEGVLEAGVEPFVNPPFLDQGSWVDIPLNSSSGIPAQLPRVHYFPVYPTALCVPLTVLPMG